jgi:hypothetical protein
MRVLQGSPQEAPMEFLIIGSPRKPPERLHICRKPPSFYYQYFLGSPDGWRFPGGLPGELSLDGHTLCIYYYFVPFLHKCANIKQNYVYLKELLFRKLYLFF